MWSFGPALLGSQGVVLEDTIGSVPSIASYLSSVELLWPRNKVTNIQIVLDNVYYSVQFHPFATMNILTISFNYFSLENDNNKQKWESHNFAEVSSRLNEWKWAKGEILRSVSKMTGCLVQTNV